MWNGSRLVHVPFYGLMENVSISHSFMLKLTTSASAAGAGKTVIWSDNISIFRIRGLTLLTSSAIIEDIRTLQKSGLASLAYFYCDFREDTKRSKRGLLSSLLVQVCEQSDAHSAILSDLYVAHGDGSQYASDRELVACLKDVIKLPGQATVHIIIDALDECQIATGLSSPHEQVSELVKDLVNLRIPNLRICVTSRPEADIVSILKPLAFRTITLHNESGQIRDIAEYVRSVIDTDRKMGKWTDTDKQLVTDVLTKKANGM